MTEWRLIRHGEPAPALPAGEVLAPEVAAEYRLVLDDGAEISVPPLDELDIYDQLPRIPDATVVVHYEVTNTPIGMIRVELHIVDGAMVRSKAVAEFAETQLPLVRVSIAWDQHLEFRSGRASLLEALEGATIEARWQTLLLVHGLVQQREWSDALRSRPPLGPGVPS